MYEDSIKDMLEKLTKQQEIVSIYQIGSVSNPGISDIDVVVVLKDKQVFHLNPLEGLSELERYLFLHPLHGVSQSDFSEAKQYALFHNWNLLWGEELIVEEDNLSEDEINCLKIQTALEYLISNYISLTVLITYTICNVRALLLTMKEMLYDLQLLGVSSGGLYDLIKTLVEWRNNWFEKTPKETQLAGWIFDCHTQLRTFLETFLRSEKLYIPEWGTFQIAKNVTLVPSDHFLWRRKGIALPSMLRFMGKKYLKMQRHLNEFFFYIPIQQGEAPPVLLKRFGLEYRMVSFIQGKELMPLRSTLNFIRKIHFYETQK
jgi:hypothetical protein